jgi:hypothetical protein
MTGYAELPKPVHWLPHDPSLSPFTACGLDIDKPYPGSKQYPSWSRSRQPYGRAPDCEICAEAVLT